MKLVKEHIDFKRNVEPKDSMGTGAIKPDDITSEVLYDMHNLSLGWTDYIDGDLTFTKLALKTYEDIILFGESFDWKEDDEEDEYVNKNIGKYGPYVYNACPWSDTSLVVFSKIEFPNATKIDE